MTPGVETVVVTFRVTELVWFAARLTMTLVAVEVEFVNTAEGPLVKTGKIDAETFTFPAKLLKLLRAMVEVPNEPTVNVKEGGLAEIAKNGEVP